MSGTGTGHGETAAENSAADDTTDRDNVLDTLLGPGAQVRPGSEARPGCTLVGGIGLPWLRDLDFGTNWLARAAELSWPDEVVLEDLSYSAHRVLHRIQELEPGRVILLGCMPRGVDRPGTIRQYRLGDVPPAGTEEVHERLAESVGGIIDLDHTVAVCRHWGALDDEVIIIEVEPEDREFGWGFSGPVEEAVTEVVERVRQLVGDAA